MKRKLLTLLILCATPLAAAITRASNTNIYLPIVTTPQPRTGIAWSVGCFQHKDLDTYNAHYCYATHYPEQVHHFTDRILPIVRPPYVIEFATELNNANYQHPILLFNEPDLASQDELNPSAAAQLFHQAQTICPKCKWVTPNTSQLGNSWARNFAAAYAQLYGTPPVPHAWATHFYQWHQNHSITMQVTDFCTALELANCNVWITEYGTCHEQLATALINQTLNHPQIQKAFWFTNRNSIPTGSCSQLIDPQGRETPIGTLYRTNPNTQ